MSVTPPATHHRDSKHPARQRRLLSWTLLLSGIGALALVISYRVAVTTPLAIAKQGEHYLIARGATLNSIAVDLEKRRILTQPFWWIVHARAKHKAEHLQAGEYWLTPGMTASDLLNLFVAGKVAYHSFTIVEGWTFRRLVQELAAYPQLVRTLDGLDDVQIMQRLGAPGVHPEGRFFPETYHFPHGTRDIDFLRRARSLMQERLADEWRKRAPGLPYRRPDEALIMASVIEKETGLARERPAIAGVLVRRLRQGMLLQTDPSLIYGLGLGFDGDIRTRDFKFDSPYNSYLYPGLPPTPIALAGGEALHAALHPAPGDSLYFVSRGDGSHHFSATLEEHNSAVARFQLHRKPHGH